jgi:hypothetical protein
MRFLWRRARPRPSARTVRPESAARSGPSGAFARLAEIEAQARYHRDRLALYRARMHGAHPTSLLRLRELERAASAADDRLRTARREAEREHPA